MTFDLHESDEVSSTNDVVRRAILDGAPEGFAVCARRQTGGYGRRGHSWMSPPGGLYISFLLEPSRRDCEVATLGMVAALAVCRSIESFASMKACCRVAVKWPNDVVVLTREGTVDAAGGFRKICGISTEKIGPKVCLGVGVNVLRPDLDPNTLVSGDLASGGSESLGRNLPVYLEDISEAGARASVPLVRDALLSELGFLYEEWQHGGFASIAHQVNERFALKDRKVVVSCGSGDAPRLRGIALGVGDDGALILSDSASHDLLHIYDGTVSLA